MPESGCIQNQSFGVGGGENVPGIPGACATCNFTYLVVGPCKKSGNRPSVINYLGKSKYCQKYADHRKQIIIQYQINPEKRNEFCLTFDDIDDLEQDCSNSTANALNLLQSYTEPSIHSWDNRYIEHICNFFDTDFSTVNDLGSFQYRIKPLIIWGFAKSYDKTSYAILTRS